MGKTKEEHIQLLDNRIEKADITATKLESGNDNDKAVAALLREKVENTWVAQKTDIETDDSE